MKLLLVLFSAFLLTATAFAAEKGTLKVRILDDEGVPLPGVSVTLSSPQMMGTRTRLTNEMGEALFINLTPGVYQIQSTLDGFQEKISTGIQISLDHQTTIEENLSPTTLEETITVTAVSPAVDATKSVIAEYVTASTVESLPVARDFVGYLQLASGVNVVPNSGGRDTPEDPAGKGGLNYADRGTQRAGGGNAKTGSRDNYYYLDGINVTGLATQTALMTFNNEVIQEQELLTSGVPAEYAGGKGVVGNVVTKTGGNLFSGSANLYMQPQSFWLDYGGSDYDAARDPTMLEGFQDNQYDTAGTLGGPIMKDKVWFFLSGQYRNNSRDYALSESASSIREETSFKQRRYGLYGKFTFKPTGNDTFTALGFYDNFLTQGDQSPNTLIIRESVFPVENKVMSFYYQRLFGENVIVDLRYGRYWRDFAQEARYPGAGPFTTVRYLPGQYPTIENYSFGGPGGGFENTNTRDQFSANVEWYWGNMRIKWGAMYSNETDLDNNYTNYGATYAAIDPSLAGITLEETVVGDIWSESEWVDRLTPWMNANWDPTADSLDANHDGVLTVEEVGAATFTAQGEHGLNFLRTYERIRGTNKVRAQRFASYLMNDWRINDYLTANVGVRAVLNRYYDSEGEEILFLPFQFLPRIGLAWNIGGTGTHKLTIFYGQYLDDIPFGMIHFGGNISGRVRDEQVWLNNDWYTFRIRGSAEVRDCSWTPNTRDARSVELSLTHQIDVGNGLVFTTQGFYRNDRKIIEDYDLLTYVTGIDRNDINWGHLALTFEDFGFPATGLTREANYYLSNLIGAKRDYYGLDFEVRKRFTNGSSVTAQYSFRDAKGNSQSDGNADIQGDFLSLDPRNPWMWGTLPGSIDHQIKLFGTYRLPFGLDIGTFVYWASGLNYTDATVFGPGTYNIYVNRRLPDSPDGRRNYTQTGTETGPSFYQIDLRFTYNYNFSDNLGIQFFADIFNITNNQQGIDEMYAHNDPQFTYQETTALLNPMRFYLGFRINFRNLAL